MLQSLFGWLFDPAGLTPHGFCLSWEPGLIWLHAVSDAAIGLSYYAIPLALGYFVSQRRDLAFGWIFWLFAAFILACGTTHLIEILTLWLPAYGAQGIVKATTAIVSVVTAVLLWPLVVRALAFPTPDQFRLVSDRLDREMGEHSRTQQKLRRTEESFQRLVNGVTDYAIFMLDPNGVVATWNTGAERMKGYQEDETLGQHFSVFYPQSDRDAGLPALALETVAREGRHEAEGWRLRRDGSRFWASVIIDPLRDEAGRPVGYVKVTRDITERRQAEEVLEQTRSALAQSQKMETIGQLAGGIAHDFNNLLTAILGNASVLERRFREQLGAEGMRLLSTVRGAGERAAALTHQLLAFSRRQTLAPRIVDANKLVTGMSELLRRTLGEAIAIETALAGGLWQAFADANQLENAILNLAVNARDAMPDGGRLTLETGNVYLDEGYASTHAEVTPGQYVMIAVSDTGTGMSPETMRKAFDPFFTTKAEGRGTGLGLSQVFGFVKQSGGHVSLYSELGHGTTVKIYLPRNVATEEGEAEEKPGYAHIPRGRGETVLVVEDDEGVRDYVANALRHLGYRVLHASDGRRALDLLTNNPGIALLLTDVGLPRINGAQLADLARQHAPQLKVVFMTGYGRNAISHHGLLDRGADLLPKPFTVEVLAHKLSEVLDRADGAREAAVRNAR